MINIKSKQELELMKHGGHILSLVLYEVMGSIRPGVSELELDQLAEKLIIEKGAQPGFKKVKGYYHTICMSTNDAVVHGIPGGYKFKEGDVVGVDCGVFYKGFHTDMAETKLVKSSKPKIQSPVEKFLEVGKYALNEGIKQAVLGNRIGHISKAIQDIVEVENGYSVVRSLIGHGVGRELHEEPEVPGYLVSKIEKTPFLKEGMTIAIEVIYNMGSKDVVLDPDGWTIKTQDGKIAGLFERTVAITKGKPLLITS